MAFTLQNSLNYALTQIEYSPLTVGLGGEPAVSIASMIRNTILNPPLTWFFNRTETTFPTVVGQQDYAEAGILDLSFVEKVALSDDQGNIWELKDVYNNSSLSVSSFQQRPSAMSVQTSDSVNGCKFRFLGVPDQVYTVTVTYQKLSPQFGPFFITSNANASAGNTAYTGSFDVLSFPTGASVIITGMAASANNGTFTVVSVTTTTLTVNNSAGTVSTGQSGYVSNYSWAPIPDQYSDVYNNLFLAEALATVDDNRAQLYRQRGVAALMAKASGLTEMQKNAFAQQWLQRGWERQGDNSIITLGNTGRSN